LQMQLEKEDSTLKQKTPISIDNHHQLPTDNNNDYQT